MCNCRECGEPVPETRKSEALFCSVRCRTVFNNRRQTRGAELYDLFMALRYDRENSRVIGVWAFVCRVAQLYRDEDIQQRGGRPSWVDPKTVMARKPWLRAKITRISV